LQRNSSIASNFLFRQSQNASVEVGTRVRKDQEILILPTVINRHFICSETSGLLVKVAVADSVSCWLSYSPQLMVALWTQLHQLLLSLHDVSYCYS